MNTKLFSRFLKIILSIMMIINMMPMNVLAEESEDTDYLFVATDRHTDTSIIGNLINKMEEVIGENKLEYLALGGDMVGSGNNHPAYNSSTVLGEVTAATSSLSAKNVDIVAGIHDMKVTDDAGIVLPYEGGGAQIYEGDRYYVYGVEEYCISEDSNSSNWSSEAQKFVDWANGDNIDKSKVIIVVSHYPLHAKRDDNDGAYYWHQALNTVATSGDTTVERDIVFFHGHNHTKDKTEYVYKVGEEMSIQNGSNTTSGTIYYTYATAGYLSTQVGNGQATLVSITDDQIVLEKYSTTSATPMATVDRVVTEDEVTLSSIAVTTQPAKTVYTVGDTFSADGLVVTATYSDNSTKEVTADVTLSGYDMSTAGTQTVTVAYEDMTATFDITVNEEITLASVAVTTQPAKTVYTVGDTFSADGLVVTATYSDNSTKDVSADVTLSGYDMSTAGTQTVTVTYEGKTATFNITVNEAVVEPTINTVEAETGYMDGESFVGNGGIVTAKGLGLTEVTALFNEVDLSETYGNDYYFVYDVSLDGYVENESTIVSFNIANTDLTGATVYLVAEDGTLTPVTGTIEYVAETNESVVTFETTGESFTVAFGVAEVVVPEDYTLTSFEITNPADTLVYFQEDANVDGILPLDISNLELTATYTGSGDPVTKVIEWNEFGKIEDGYSISVDMTKIGKQDVVLSYTYGENTLTTTYEITIGHKSYTYSDSEDNSNTVTLDFAVAGVTEVTVEDNTATEFVVTAMSKVEVDSYISYDINLTGYTQGDKVTVTLSIPEDVDNPKVYYVDEEKGNATALEFTISADGKTVSFVTDHFSTYVLADGTVIETESGNATTEGSSTTTTKDVWVKVDAPTNNGEYFIVSTGTAGTSGYVMGNSTAVTPASGTLTVNGTAGTYTYIETTGTVWTASGSGTSWSFANGSNYLGYTQTSSGNEYIGGLTYSYIANSVASSTTWTLNNNQLYIYLQSSTQGSIYGGSNSSANYYLTGTGGESWELSTTSSNVYFYQKVTATVTTGTVDHIYSVEGADITDAVAISGQTVTLSSVLYDTPDGGTTTDITASSGLTPTYEVVTTKGNPNVISGINESTATLSGVAGTAVVKVTYTSGDLVAWDEFVVTTTAPDHYGIQLHKAEMTKVTDVTADNVANYYVFNSTTGAYEKATSYDASITYYTTPVIPGDEITAPVALKGIEAGDTYSVWAIVKAYATADDNTGTDLGALGDALSWTVSDETIATINKDTGVITFTGANYGTFTVTVSYKGADGKVITDTITISATETLYVVPGDGTDDFPEYPNEGAVRFDKTATAVGNYSETGIALVELSMTGVPYSTGSEIDVVVMLDMTGSMSDDGMEAAEEATKAFVEKIVKNEDGLYNKNRIAVYAFNSGSSSPYELVSLNTISSDSELETANTAIDTASDKQASGGTPFDEAAKKMYDVLQAAKTTNLPEGIESADDYNRQQFAVFMSDGGPTSYEGSDGYTYYGGNNTSGDRAITSYIGGYTSSTSSNWTYNLPTEYWTDQMKTDGVTVYTVGLLLQNAPSNPAPYSSMTDSTYDSTTDSLTSIGSHYYFTSTILKQMATEESKYIDIFDVDNADKATAAFTSIALSIREAATNVVVKDKVGNNYSVNFSIPGLGTDNAVSEEALDGLTEFYIQVVEYTLDATTHERTNVYTVLENFTFNTDGTLKSHTVDGTECSDCSHVTTTEGKITALDGTYFDYKSDSTGEYLTWTAEKLTSNELALQYFAYLDNSSGVAASDQIPPGTYYTNEYATLTYDNVNGNRVQQEFPVPQMTWYGAQVSYVFYLVNEAGQPVNKAGRVVPFAEAVYVTDVNTFAVIWNDLEQSAGLEADHLAEELVPEVYALYDNDASYSIHVYADEEGTNLNNHFVIGGDVTDEYNTENSWTNAKTTYVFNTKADGTKYNVVGAFIANDGSDTTTSNGYYCKSAYLANATYTTSVDDAGVTVHTVTSVGDGYQTVAGETQVLASAFESTTGGTVIDDYVYYVDENGVYTIVQKTDGTEVHKGFDFANTTVAFAVVWKPQLEPDTVVVDYGLDVVIDVIKNDSMAAGVTGVMLTAPNAETDGTYDTSVGEASVTSSDGLWTASKESLTSVRFSMNEMGMSDAVTFYYEAGVNYYTYDAEDKATLNTTNMYSSVTVVPATTIYYEDEYVKYTGGAWEKITDSTVVSGKPQNIDRPGSNKLGSGYDSDNVYGYDGTYTNSSTYSLGSVMKATVSSTNYTANAEFLFYGTGFDIISLTNDTTGTILVEVLPVNADGTTGKSVKNLVVDTYYGYKYVDGQWIVDSDNTSDNLYQIPVLKVNGLTYGKYKVKITVSYNSFFDHNNAGTYDFYLDSIRIYDPANDGASNEVVQNAYKADSEGWPSYTEVRNMLINKDDFYTAGATTTTNGIIFIDGIANLDDTTVENVTTYANFGPNNEVYLAAGQAIAFDLNAVANEGTEIAKVQIALKSATGTIKYLMYHAGDNKPVENTLSTAHDMYYDITDLNGKTVVIANTGTSGILSITNIKVTYDADQGGDVDLSDYITSDRETETNAVWSLRRFFFVEEEVNTPEVELPEVTNPEINTPEVETPEVELPEVNTPEVNVPDNKVEENVSGSDNVVTTPVAPEAPTGEPVGNGDTSTGTEDSTLESDETDVEVTPDTGVLEDEADAPTTGTNDTKPAEQLGFFASLIKTIVNFIVSVLSWFTGIFA